MRMIQIWETPWQNSCLCRFLDHTPIANHIHTHAHTNTTHTYMLQSWFGSAEWVHVTLWWSKGVGWGPVLLKKHAQSIQLSWECKSKHCAGKYRTLKQLLRKLNRGCKSDTLRGYARDRACKDDSPWRGHGLSCPEHSIVWMFPPPVHQPVPLCGCSACMGSNWCEITWLSSHCFFLPSLSIRSRLNGPKVVVRPSPNSCFCPKITLI